MHHFIPYTSFEFFNGYTTYEHSVTNYVDTHDLSKLISDDQAPIFTLKGMRGHHFTLPRYYAAYAKSACSIMMNDQSGKVVLNGIIEKGTLVDYPFNKDRGMLTAILDPVKYKCMVPGTMCQLIPMYKGNISMSPMEFAIITEPLDKLITTDNELETMIVDNAFILHPTAIDDFHGGRLPNSDWYDSVIRRLGYYDVESKWNPWVHPNIDCIKRGQLVYDRIAHTISTISSVDDGLNVDIFHVKNNLDKFVVL